MGLFPFSFILNPEDGFETVNMNTFFFFGRFKCALLKGTVLSCLVVVSNRRAAAHYITAFMVSFPMSMLMAFVIYITNEMQLIQCPLLLSALYMFRAVFPPIIRCL